MLVLVRILLLQRCCWYKADQNFVKWCASWGIYVSRGNTFQMIILDIINSLFKCWIRFNFRCVKAVVHNKLIKMLVKGCSNFSNKELWCKLDWYFIGQFSIFWEAWCFWGESNQFFFYMFRLLMLLFYEINQFFFCLFKNLIILIKLGLDFSLKLVFRK